MSNNAPLSDRQRQVALNLQKGTHWFSRHWLAFFNIIMAIYVGLPILAPTLMNFGLTTPANAIYTIYSPMCHQMASRSFFLFGDQVAYPRPYAGDELPAPLAFIASTNLTPIDDYLDSIPEFNNVSDDNWLAFTLAARAFRGNEQMGYKMALCERDIAIYGFILIAGLLYGLIRRFRPVPRIHFLVFVFIGVGPIALDGFSQLFAYYATPINGADPHPIQTTLATLFPLRESTPFLRTFTGALFGFMLTWYAYPYIGEAMDENEQELNRKLQRANAKK
ncbi:MAG TPA: DUF2085 domain-containing protein [Anaerolineae bacterium]|nr:DUF2085 domain-containing protein [Anaerolineae bacterium]